MHTIHYFVLGIVVAEKEESCHNPDMETSKKDVSAESHARVQSTHSFTMGACFAVDSTGLCTVDPRVFFLKWHTVSPSRQTDEHGCFSSLAWRFDHS